MIRRGSWSKPKSKSKPPGVVDELRTELNVATRKAEEDKASNAAAEEEMRDTKGQLKDLSENFLEVEVKLGEEEAKGEAATSELARLNGILQDRSSKSNAADAETLTRDDALASPISSTTVEAGFPLKAKGGGELKGPKRNYEAEIALLDSDFEAVGRIIEDTLPREDAGQVLSMLKQLALNAENNLLSLREHKRKKRGKLPIQRGTKDEAQGSTKTRDGIDGIKPEQGVAGLLSETKVENGAGRKDEEGGKAARTQEEGPAKAGAPAKGPAGHDAKDMKKGGATGEEEASGKTEAHSKSAGGNDGRNEVNEGAAGIKEEAPAKTGAPSQHPAGIPGRGRGRGSG